MCAEPILSGQLIIKDRAAFSESLFIALQRILTEKSVQSRIFSVGVKMTKRRDILDVVQYIKKAVLYFGEQFNGISFA